MPPPGRRSLWLRGHSGSCWREDSTGGEVLLERISESCWRGSHWSGAPWRGGGGPAGEDLTGGGGPDGSCWMRPCPRGPVAPQHHSSSPQLKVDGVRCRGEDSPAPQRWLSHHTTLAGPWQQWRRHAGEVRLSNTLPPHEDAEGWQGDPTRSQQVKRGKT